MVDFGEKNTFTINNLALASLLHLCGEKCLNSSNQYEAEKLRETNSKASVLSGRGIAGSVGYTFHLTDRAQQIIKFVNEQDERSRIGVEVAIEADEWTVATLCAAYIDTMNKLGKWWKSGASTILDRTGDKSFVIVSTNASKETLKHCQ